MVSCGALNSALLLLGSASDAHPNGLANGPTRSAATTCATTTWRSWPSRTPNPTRFQKTLALNDWYLRVRTGTTLGRHPDARQVRRRAAPGQAPHLAWGAKLTPDASRGGRPPRVDFWLSSEDLPRPDSRITIDDDGPARARPEEQHGGLKRMRRKFDSMLGRPRVPREVPRTGRLPHEGDEHRGHRPPGRHRAVRHRPGDVGARRRTARPTKLDNLYVVDSSFFVSIGAVNPTLTIIANALRVGEHLVERLESSWTVLNAATCS